MEGAVRGQKARRGVLHRYLAMASTLGVAAVAALAFMPLDRVPIEVIAMCAFAISVQISVVDLLTEAKYVGNCTIPPSHARMHARSHARSHARTHARSHARTHARTHARSHTPTRAHVRRYAETHLCARA